MERRLRINLVLAGVVAALAAVIWLAPSPHDDMQAHYLLDPEAPVERLVSLQGDAVHFDLRRAADGWQLAQPRALPADAFQVGALIEELRRPFAKRYPITEADLDELGLENSEWRLRVNDAEFRIGGRAPLGHQRYLLAGAYVYLVDETLVFRAQRAALDYASRAVLPANARVTALTLPSFALTQTGGRWQAQPDDAALSADALQRLVDAWQQATASKVVPADSVPRDGVAAVRFADGQELRFGIERSEAELRLTRDDPAVTYILPAPAARDLLHPASE